MYVKVKLIKPKSKKHIWVAIHIQYRIDKDKIKQDCCNNTNKLIRWYAIYSISAIEFVRILLGDMLFYSISPIEFLRIFILFTSVWILLNRYLNNAINNHLKISRVSLPWPRIALITSFNIITQPWHELRAILWIHVIIHIFIKIHHKLFKFSTHKLQIIWQSKFFTWFGFLIL